MREILFRGKRITDGKLVEGMPVANSAGEIHSIMKFNSEIEILEIGSEVEQYTGLTDKNGKKIWEGDIVQSIELELKGIIVFDEYCRFMIKDFPTNATYLLAHNNDEIKVIGNIHDNPELLKGDAEK